MTHSETQSVDALIEDIAVCLFVQDGGSLRDWNRFLPEHHKDEWRDKASAVAEAIDLETLVTRTQEKQS